MRVVSAEEVHAALDYPGLVEALRELYRRGVDLVEVLHLTEKLRGDRQNDWLILPAWQFGRHHGVKLVSVYPGNEAKGLASILGVYLLFDGSSGQPLACIDGAALTLRKTAANSALGATYLAREDARTMLMVGAGALGPHLIAAHAAVRPIAQVLIWNRTPERARRLAAGLRAEPPRPGLEIRASEDLEGAVRQADVISCATMATAPLIRGAWLKPGSHLDLVGGYRLDMREADDEAVRRARVFIDAWFTAGHHTGDICQPLAAGLIDKADIADAFQLARGERAGRLGDGEITLFKNGGGGHEDLGTAQHLMTRLA